MLVDQENADVVPPSERAELGLNICDLGFCTTRHDA
jgi:hypothetical protein